jgi:hypothetical protein
MKMISVLLISILSLSTAFAAPDEWGNEWQTECKQTSGSEVGNTHAHASRAGLSIAVGVTLGYEYVDLLCSSMEGLCTGIAYGNQIIAKNAATLTRPSSDSFVISYKSRLGNRVTFLCK